MELLQLFRKIALLEGLSFIVLMFIAMPLKRIWGMPEAVTWVGWIHGVLFVLYVCVLFFVWRMHAWNRGRVAIAFVASILPFGTIIFDRSLKREVASLRV